jgi:hypothetical protein
VCVCVFCSTHYLFTHVTITFLLDECRATVRLCVSGDAVTLLGCGDMRGIVGCVELRSVLILTSVFVCVCVCFFFFGVHD